MSKNETPSLPDQKYFSIREACKLTRLPAATLRFWEQQFKQLKPEKNRSGQRAYRKKDLELLFRIKHLLHEQKFTLEGARRALSRPEPGSTSAPAKKTGHQLGLGFEENLFRDKLKRTLKELREIEKQLRA